MVAAMPTDITVTKSYRITHINGGYVLQEMPSARWVCHSASEKYFKSRLVALGVPFDTNADGCLYVPEPVPVPEPATPVPDPEPEPPARTPVPVDDDDDTTVNSDEDAERYHLRLLYEHLAEGDALAEAADLQREQAEEYGFDIDNDDAA